KDPATVKPQALAARAIPDWLAAEVTLSPADLRALQTPPVLWLRARTAHREALLTELPDLDHPSGLPPTALRYHGERDLFRTEAFRQGWFEIQDFGSQQVGHACAPRP